MAITNDEYEYDNEHDYDYKHEHERDCFVGLEPSSQ